MRFSIGFTAAPEIVCGLGEVSQDLGLQRDTPSAI